MTDSCASKRSGRWRGAVGAGRGRVRWVWNRRTYHITKFSHRTALQPPVDGHTWPTCGTVPQRGGRSRPPRRGSPTSAGPTSRYGQKHWICRTLRGDLHLGAPDRPFVGAGEGGDHGQLATRNAVDGELARGVRVEVTADEAAGSACTALSGEGAATRELSGEVDVGRARRRGGPSQDGSARCPL